MTIGVTEFLKVRGTLLQVAIVHEALAAIDPELDFQEGEQAFLTPADFSTKLISHLTNRGLRVYRKVSASLN